MVVKNCSILVWALLEAENWRASHATPSPGCAARYPDRSLSALMPNRKSGIMPWFVETDERGRGHGSDVCGDRRGDDRAGGRRRRDHRSRGGKVSRRRGFGDV